MGQWGSCLFPSEKTGVGKKVQHKGNVMDEVAKQAQLTGRKDLGGRRSRMGEKA